MGRNIWRQNNMSDLTGVSGSNVLEIRNKLRKPAGKDTLRLYIFPESYHKPLITLFF